MDKSQKVNAILEIAKAFYNRGACIQYDQRSLDRIVQLTPRATKYMPPEAATSQNTVFLDCATFMNSIYYQTFGEELAADLTWHMIDYVKPRVMYYEFSHNESEKELDEIEVKMRELLEPGDIITYSRINDSGHTVMYIGDNKFIHCIPNGRPNSYDYENCKSREYPDGGIFIHDISLLFERDNEENIKRCSVLSCINTRFSISRPLDIMGELSENAISRLNNAKDLWCEVIASHSGGKHAFYGEEVEYTVFVRNIGSIPKDVTINIQGNITGKTVLPDEIVSVSFLAKVDSSQEFKMRGPKVTVNNLEIYVPEILVGNPIDNTMLEKITEAVKAKINDKTSALEAASSVYGEYGIEVEDDERKNIQNCFSLHDSTKGDVLSRKIINIKKDCGVYSLFGGYGVVTPEIKTNYKIRCVKIQRKDLMPGDIILCSDDPYGNDAYSSFCTGDALTGCFQASGKQKTIRDSEMDEFIDSLFGRFCFVVLRPYM